MRVLVQIARAAAEELGASAPAAEKTLLAEGASIAKGAKGLVEEAYSLMSGVSKNGGAHGADVAKSAVKSAVKADVPSVSPQVSANLAEHADRLQDAPLSSQLRFISERSSDIIGNGGRFGDALVGRDNNTISVLFDSGRFKGASALVDRDTILYQRGSRVIDLPLNSTEVAWRDAWSKFVNGR